MSWYASAMGFIKQQKLDNPGMTQQELRRHCSKNYPFRERKGYAYKSFLEAMRDEFGRVRPPSNKAGQGDIFREDTQ